MPNRKQSAMEKPKNFGASIAFVWSYLRRRKPLLFLAGLMVLFNIGATLAGTAMLQPIIDNFLEPVRALSVSERFAGLLQKHPADNSNASDDAGHVLCRRPPDARQQ